MFTSKRKISFYDCDPAGILFFARIYEICHSAYEELISSFDLQESYWSNDIYAVPIIKSEAQYINTIKYGDLITTELTVSEIKSSSFVLNYICKNEKGETCAIVKTVHVFVDRKIWKKTNIASKVADGLKKHTADWK